MTLVLIDQPDYCEERGWVEAIVSEERAREVLAEFVGEDPPQKPTGPARRVTLRLRNPAAHYEDQRWVECSEAAKTGRAFWQIDCTEWEGMPA
jgi:hypothetical protein